jgi:hypothetical protein
MHFELWSEPRDIGDGWQDGDAKHVFMPDSFGDLRGNLEFVEFVRLQIASHTSIPNSVMVVVEADRIQFSVNNNFFDYLVQGKRFSTLVKKAARRFIEFNSEETRKAQSH